MSARSNIGILLLLLVIPVTHSCRNGRGNRTENLKSASDARSREVRAPLRAPEQEAPPKQEVPQEGRARAPEEQLFREACLQGLAAEVEKLLKSGIDPDAVDANGRTGLMLASFNGHTDIVNMLLDHRATVNRADYMGRTALMYASTGQFPETVKVLLSNGAETNIADNDEGFTALMFAAAEGNARVVRLLLDHGANPDIRDIDGDNAETFARQNGHTEVAAILGK